MTLQEGKSAIEKYRYEHDLYVSIKEPTKTHKEIYDVMMSELKSAGYISLDDFFEAIFWNNIDLVCIEYNIKILIEDKEIFYNLLEGLDGEINIS